MRILLAAVLVLSATQFAPAADPPAKGRARARARPADEPPPCRHLVAKAAPRRPPPQTMPQMFDRMMGDMARNPATGFVQILKDQEAAAIQGTRLTVAEERRIGRKQRDAFLRAARTKGFTLRDNARDVDYLKGLVERFAPRMKNRDRYPEIDVTLIDAPIPDGQSFPGGFLVFTSALLDEPDEATVAGVVAHEMNHLDRGHLNEYARREKLAETAFRPSPDSFANPAALMTRGMALGSLMLDPFRPEHEHEADCAAVTWLYQEGYDPRALADFFTRMHRRNQDQPDAPFWRVARSHPYSLARRDAVRERSTQLQRWKPRADLGFYPDNLKERKLRER